MTKHSTLLYGLEVINHGLQIHSLSPRTKFPSDHTLCYGLNCVPTKFYTEAQTPQCNGIWRWGHWEVTWSWEWVLLTALVPLRDACLSLCPTAPRKKRTMCKPGKEPSSGSDPANTRIMDSPDFRRAGSVCDLSYTVINNLSWQAQGLKRLPSLHPVLSFLLGLVSAPKCTLWPLSTWCPHH